MIRLYIAPLLLCCCALLYSLPAHAQDPSPKYKFVEYKVVKGDTCIGIARKVYGNGRLCFKMISKYNKMNRKFVIVTGRILRLPTKEELGVKPNKPDAIVTGRKGNVETRAPKKTSWSRASKGNELYTLWRVNSGKRSSAEVTFTENDSALQMRENTLVIIYGPRKNKSRRVGSKAVLERGTLRSRMAALSGKKKNSMIVETPASTATLGSGEAVINVAEEGVTRVANHSAQNVSLVGKDAPEPKRKKRRRRKKKKRKIVRLPKNMGSKIVPGKDPSPPKPLPPAPQWTSVTPTNVLAIGSTNNHTVEWKSVPQATRYRVELLNDAAGLQVMDRFFVNGRYDSINLQNLPPQTYYLRIASIDADKFEGKPGSLLQLNLVPATLTRAKAIEKDNGVYYVGSSININGANCSTDEKQKPSDSLVFYKAGKQKLSCVNAQGQALEPMNVTIRDMRVDGLSFASALPLPPSVTQEVTFSTSPSAKDVSFVLPEGVELVSKSQLEDGRWQAKFTRKKDAKASMQQVKVYLGEVEQDVQIATIPLEVLAQGQAPTQGVTILPAFDTWTFGGFTQIHALHSDTYKVDGAQAGPGFRVGVDGRYTPFSWLGLGARLSVGNNEMAQQVRSFDVAGLSAYGNLNILTGSLRPHLRLGTGVEALRYDRGYDDATQSWERGERGTEVFVDHHAGLGLDIALAPRVLFNASIMQHMLPWGDEFSMYTSAGIGLSGLF